MLRTSETMRWERKAKVFEAFLQSLKGLSTCKRKKCACIICDRDFMRVYSIGYNGPPSGIDNDSCTDEPKQCGCVHAEANALIKLGEVQEAYILSLPPRHIRNSIWPPQ